MNTHKTNDEVISAVNDLIETCKDGEEGYRTAGEAVQNPELRTLFLMLAQQRARFSAELNSEVLHHGGKPAESGHVAASLHRGWTHLVSSVSGKNDTAVIDECERGEDAAMEAYQKALQKGLPGDVMSIIETQYADIRKAHETLRGLKHAAHAAH